jgi:predicted permease
MRLALRRIRLEPILCLTIVAGWTVALGTSTAAFSLIKAVLFRTPGVAAPESAWRIIGGGPAFPNWTYDEFRHIQRSTTSLAVAGHVLDRVGYSVEAAQAARSISMTAVSGDFFGLLGGGVSKGRPILAADDVAGAAPVVVVSQSFWKKDLGASDEAIGQTLRLDGRSFTVVGVAEPKFYGPNLRTPPAVWMSLTTYGEIWHGRPGAAFERDAVPIEVLARLVPDANVAKAEAELGVIEGGLAIGSRQNLQTMRRLLPLIDRRAEPALMMMVTALMTAVALVVTLAAANAANLLLASGVKRTREFGVRLALGASAFRLARQLFVESLLLAALGGAGGLWVATSLVSSLSSLLSLPWMDNYSLDAAAYIWLIALITTVAAAAALAPVRYGRRADVLSAMKDSHQPALQVMSTSRLRSALVALQAMTSVVLLVIAGLLTKSMMSARSFDPGFDIDHVMTVSMEFGPGFDNDRAAEFWSSALDTVRGISGVRGAGLVQHPPFDRGFPVQYLPNGHRLYRNEVSPAYFSVVGLPVLGGRTFNASENNSSAGVALISESLAGSSGQGVMRSGPAWAVCQSSPTWPSSELSATA